MPSQQYLAKKKKELIEQERENNGGKKLTAYQKSMLKEKELDLQLNFIDGCLAKMGQNIEVEDEDLRELNRKNEEILKKKQLAKKMSLLRFQTTE